MRIDKWLKVARIIKRRETAKALCEDGDVYLNDRPAKPSSEAKEGDTISIALGRHTVVVAVKSIRPYASKEEAAEMFEIISDTVSERSDHHA